MCAGAPLPRGYFHVWIRGGRESPFPQRGRRTVAASTGCSLKASRHARQALRGPRDGPRTTTRSSSRTRRPRRVLAGAPLRTTRSGSTSATAAPAMSSPSGSPSSASTRTASLRPLWLRRWESREGRPLRPDPGLAADRTARLERLGESVAKSSSKCSRSSGSAIASPAARAFSRHAAADGSPASTDARASASYAYARSQSPIPFSSHHRRHRARATTPAPPGRARHTPARPATRCAPGSPACTPPPRPAYADAYAMCSIRSSSSRDSISRHASLNSATPRCRSSDPELTPRSAPRPPAT